MYVYKAERDAGLAESLQQRRPVVLACALEAVRRDALPAGLSVSGKDRPKRAVASLGDDDLFWFKSLLVSSGFNDNDHFFDVGELYAARATPEHKPINVGHVQHDIVGHMVGCYAVGADRTTVVEDDTDPDELPSELHLIDAGVLYRRWEDDAVQARVDKVIAAVADGSLSVSMETWYKSFDYVLEDPDGTLKVVSRKKETAGLTRHLRFFGGSGRVDGRRLGMLLRGMTFTGKGLVETPANPASTVIETENDQTGGNASASVVYSQSEPKEQPMANEVADKALAEVAEWKARFDESDKLARALKAQVDEAAAKLKESTEALAAAAAELKSVKAAQAKAQRLEAAHAQLNIPRDEAGRAKAEKFVQPLESLSDESFQTVLKNQAELVGAATKTLAEVAPGKADASQLEAVVADPKLALAVAATDDVLKTVTAALNERYKVKGN